MKIIPYTNKLFCSLFILLFISSCSAQDTAPTDQLIEGPFNITTEWQVIQLKKPLNVIPQVITLETLFDIGKYTFVDSKEQNTEFSLMSDRLKRLSDNKIITPEIILIDSQKREFRPVFISVGVAYTEVGNLKALGFGTNSNIGKFIYPKGTEFIGVKIKANTKMTIDHFRWVARHYFQAPNAKWRDIDPSEIVNLK
ncbi:MAG: hypothetical protein ACRBCI_14310 [Cellvibrionaceae bacterium]